MPKCCRKIKHYEFYNNRNNNDGQMYVIEVLTAMLILFSATNFIVTVATPPTPSHDSLSNLFTMGGDALTTLDNMPITDDFLVYYEINETLVLASVLYYNSSLVRYISNGTSDVRDVNNVTSFFNAVFPKTISYAIYLSNGRVTIPYYTGYGQPTGESTTAHRLVMISQPKDKAYPGYDFARGVYDISIVMWYGVRGGYIT
ncbi:MAG: hypothetical protein WC974_06980 [Thermoplasmata archaeon]